MMNEHYSKNKELFSTSGWITFFLLPLIVFQSIGYCYLPRAYGLLFFFVSCLIMIFSNRNVFFSILLFCGAFFWIQNSYDYSFGYTLFTGLLVALWGSQKIISAFERERQRILKERKQFLDEKNLWVKRFFSLHRQQKENTQNFKKSTPDNNQLDFNLD